MENNWNEISNKLFNLKANKSEKYCEKGFNRLDIIDLMCQIANEVENKYIKFIENENNITIKKFLNPERFKRYNDIMQGNCVLYTKEDVEKILELQRELCFNKARLNTNCECAMESWMNDNNCQIIDGDDICNDCKSYKDDIIYINKDSILNAKYNINDYKK